MTIVQMRALGWIGGALVLCGAVSCAHQPEARGTMMNQIISDDKLAAVRICSTSAKQLVESLGTPAGQGRDGEMGTLNWSSVLMIATAGQTEIRTQMVAAWIDADGLVAGFVVNPTGMPAKPAPCREQRPSSVPGAAPVAKPKTEARAPLRATSRTLANRQTNRWHKRSCSVDVEAAQPLPCECAWSVPRSSPRC
ncbi:MAG TPA: hypothetical protein VH853_03495 [Polyangia bacterium]|jgi:hypothetical protein|nr:hypothetical protein [Polyangia bacterium]